ncbi:hypothetical protein KCP70_25125 [Salmonella enterica subsp. enterica]|nr:hypothetical protein KCP70_25125 [Salmonella enterica subsp. enterica]
MESSVSRIWFSRQGVKRGIYSAGGGREAGGRALRGSWTQRGLYAGRRQGRVDAQRNARPASIQTHHHQARRYKIAPRAVRRVLAGAPLYSAIVRHTTIPYV